MAWLVLDRLGFLRPGIRMLNLAPEAFILYFAQPILGEGYVATDVDPAIFEKFKKPVQKFDVCTDRGKFPPASFDVVMHNHVLEHVPCSVETVLSDLNALVAPGGIHVFSAPIMPNRRTEEDLDPSLTPETRRARFGQEDHLRIFGEMDFLDIAHAALPPEHAVDLSVVLSPADIAAAAIPADVLTRLGPHRTFVWRKPPADPPITGETR